MDDATQTTSLYLEGSSLGDRPLILLYRFSTCTASVFKVLLALRIVKVKAIPSLILLLQDEQKQVEVVSITHRCTIHSLSLCLCVSLNCREMGEQRTYCGGDSLA